MNRLTRVRQARTTLAASSLTGRSSILRATTSASRSGCARPFAIDERRIAKWCPRLPTHQHFANTALPRHSLPRCAPQARGRRVQDLSRTEEVGHVVRLQLRHLGQLAYVALRARSISRPPARRRSACGFTRARASECSGRHQVVREPRRREVRGTRTRAHAFLFRCNARARQIIFIRIKVLDGSAQEQAAVFSVSTRVPDQRRSR